MFLDNSEDLLHYDIKVKKSALSERSKSKGFTLVELLVVITILAILMTIGIAVYSGVQKNARDVRRKTDLRSIKVALELYYQTNGKYPNRDWVYSTTAQPWIPELTSDYMSQGVPTDPFNSGNGGPWTGTTNYRYAYWALACGGFPAGQFYVLVAQLENKTDGDNLAHKNNKWCDGNGLYSSSGWSGSAYVITSL